MRTRDSALSTQHSALSTGLLALLFAGCNVDGDSGDSGGTSDGGGSDSGSGGIVSHSADESGSDYFDNATDTYHVYTAAGLQEWAASYSSYDCTLHACISLSEEWEPVGTYSYSSSDRYTATFDGGGHTIYNLAINKSSDDYVGFFGCIGSGGTVKDLTLESPNVSGGSYVGAIVGYNYGGTIENCIVSGGTVTCSSDYVGGIVGYNYSYSSTSTVSGCSNSAAVTGYSGYVGGIVGYNGSNGEVEDCENSGTVTGSSRVGGIAGYNYNTVSECANSGAISAYSTYAGGIAGYNIGSGATVEDCGNSGNVSGYDYAGGIAGYNASSATVTGCDNSGGSVSTSGTGSYIGAVAGYNYGTVSECKWLISTAEKGIGGGTDSGATSYDVS